MPAGEGDMRKGIAGICAGIVALGGAVGAAVTEDEALGKARRAANVLSDTLRDQLAANVKEKGAGEALPQCYYQSLTIGKEVETTTGIRIKRTSLKVRNPRNAPDAFEREALERYERFRQQGSMPSDEIRQDRVDGKPVWRYTKPILMAASCIPCHGAEDELGEGVRRSLDEKYPDDKAVGYAVGDLRGIVSAVVPAE